MSLGKFTVPGGERTPGLLRRLAAVLYDCFLLAAVLFVATAVILPFNNGIAFTSSQIFYPLYLIGVSFLFYAWFWVHGGQTLGLRSWKLKVLSANRRPLTWRQAALRFIFAVLSWACAGFGFWWILFDRQKRSWHDHLSKTAVFFDAESGTR